MIFFGRIIWIGQFGKVGTKIRRGDEVRRIGDIIYSLDDGRIRFPISWTEHTTGGHLWMLFNNRHFFIQILYLRGNLTGTNE